MKDIIKQFTNKHHDIEIYIDYGAFDNLDVYVDSHTPYDHLILFRKSNPAYIGDVNYLSVTPSPNNTVDVEFQGVTYRYFEFTNENQFIIFIDMKTGAFLSLGNPKRSEYYHINDNYRWRQEYLDHYENIVANVLFKYHKQLKQDNFWS